MLSAPAYHGSLQHFYETDDSRPSGYLSLGERPILGTLASTPVEPLTRIPFLFFLFYGVLPLFFFTFWGLLPLDVFVAFVVNSCGLIEGMQKKVVYQILLKDKVVVGC
jgi:hypothetical protein